MAEAIKLTPSHTVTLARRLNEEGARFLADRHQGQKNVGVLAATGDAFLFCDVDDEVAPGWLAAMGEAVFRHDFVTCRLDSEKLNAPWLQNSLKNAQRDGHIQFHPPLPSIRGIFQHWRETRTP
jgi:hypothetical protein